MIGIEIKLSNNHTLNGQPFYDMCDELKGVYPKQFKFVGWHPACRCFAVSKLADKDTMRKYQRASDEERKRMLEEGLKGSVKEMPDNYNKWLDKNAERIANAKSLPYFIQDNYVDGKLRWQLPKQAQQLSEREQALQRTKQIADKRHAERTPEQVNNIYDRWAERNRSIIDNANYVGRKKGSEAIQGLQSRSASKDAYELYNKYDYAPKLTPKQYSNAKEASKIINADFVKPMDFKSADRGNANKHKQADCCVNSVLAMELRRRGIDCTAGFYNDFLSENAASFWRTIDGKEVNFSKLINTDISSYDNKKLNKYIRTRFDNLTRNPHSRYIVQWNNKESVIQYEKNEITKDKIEGHAIMFERLTTKEGCFYDGRDNFFTQLENVIKTADLDSLEILRVDDKLINLSPNPKHYSLFDVIHFIT